MTKNKITRLLLCFVIGFTFFFSCKKEDPDCITCPCPDCPRITSIVPNHGREGDVVILNGENFSEDPFLNLVFFNDSVQVQEIQFATTTQLQVVVPFGIKSGPVSIKINDEKGLSSDEIPDFNEAVFTVDHFVELVAGTPEVSGDFSSDVFSSQFTSLSQIAIDKTTNIIYLLDNVGGSKIKEISNGNVTELTTLTNTYVDLSIPANNKIFLARATKIDTVDISFPGNIAGVFISVSSPISILGALKVDKLNNDLYYSSINTFSVSKYNFIRKNIQFTTQPNDTLLNNVTVGGNIFKDAGIDENFNFYLCTDGAGKGYINKYDASQNYSFVGGVSLFPFFIFNPAAKSNGVFYFATATSIYKTENGDTTIIAGANNQPDFEEGLPLQARFKNITDLEFGPDNYLYIVDAGNFCIRRLKIE